MSFTDYIVVFSALLILFTEVRETYRQWSEYESPEAKTMRKMLIRYAGERERLETDRDKWVKEVSDRYMENEDLKKKIEHLRKQIPPAKLIEIDDSWHGERL
jgi:hypothetical protein